MTTNRLEAFSDGVMAIIITIMALVAIISAFFNQWIAGALYVVVALMWLISDRRIERVLEAESGR